MNKEQLQVKKEKLIQELQQLQQQLIAFSGAIQIIDELISDCEKEKVDEKSSD